MVVVDGYDYAAELKAKSVEFLNEMHEKMKALTDPGPRRLTAWSIEYTEYVLETHDERMQALWEQKA